MDNEPVVGIVGTVDIHFGMLGHGSFFTGGDRDIALTRSVIDGETLTDEGFEWNLPPREAGVLQAPEVRERRPGVRGGRSEGWTRPTGSWTVCGATTTSISC